MPWEVACKKGLYMDAKRMCGFQDAMETCVCFGREMREGCVFFEMRGCFLASVFISLSEVVGSGRRAECVGLDVCCGTGVCVWKWDARRVCVLGKLTFGTGACSCM